jgi:Ca2+-binding EF-hand superfamily protein
MRFISALLFTAILLGSTAASAQMKIGPIPLELRYKLREEAHKKHDINEDGVLDQDEIREEINENYASIDLDENGIIDADERGELMEFLHNEDRSESLGGQAAQGYAERRRKMLNTMDADRNGELSEEEFKSYYHTRYTQMDLNKDGLIDAKEYRTIDEKAARYKDYD